MIEAIRRGEGGGSFKDGQAKAKLVSSNCHTTRPGHRTPYGASAATDPGTHVCSEKQLKCSNLPPHAQITQRDLRTEHHMLYFCSLEHLNSIQMCFEKKMFSFMKVLTNIKLLMSITFPHTFKPSSVSLLTPKFLSPVMTTHQCVLP